MDRRIVFFCIIFVLIFTSATVIVKYEYSSQAMGVPGGVYSENVIIDAGHGGEDGGAVGINGILEKDINLSISEKLYEILGFYGVDAQMTRSDDISLHSEGSEKQNKRKLSDAENRVNKIKNTPNAVLISIHQNSFPSEDCKGAQVFFSKNNIMSRPLAGKVSESIKNGVNSGNKRDIKQIEDRVYLLKNVNCPAILVECGFITNSAESKLLMTDSYRTKLAACIASGYFRYSHDKGMEESL